MKERSDSRRLDSSLKCGGTKSGTGNALQCPRGIDASRPEHNQCTRKIDYSTARTSDQNDPQQIWMLGAQLEPGSIRTSSFIAGPVLEPQALDEGSWALDSQQRLNLVSCVRDIETHKTPRVCEMK